MSTTMLKNKEINTLKSPYPWLEEKRQEAHEQFQKIGFPTSKHDAWKYCDLEQDIDMNKTLSASKPDTLINQKAISVIGNQIHFGAQPEQKGLRISKLFDESVQEISKELSVGVKQTPFSYLNTIECEEGLLIHIDKKAQLKAPIQVNLITPNKPDSSTIHSRVLVVVEEGAKASVHLHHINQADQTHFTNEYLDIVVKKNAALELVQVQENDQPYRFATLHTQLHEKAEFNSVSFIKNGLLTRQDSVINFHGKEAKCELLGLSLLGQSSRYHNHVKVNHFKGDGHCKQHFKTILTDKALSEFSGLVFVQEGAHGTDSSQLNQNLVLSDKARSLSRPQLRIDADDVACAHGSTTGQLNPEEIVYLQSRGLSYAESVLLLTTGFGQEIINKISDAALRNKLEQSFRSVLNAIETADV